MKCLVYVRPSEKSVELCTKADGHLETWKLSPSHARLLAEDLLRTAREINGKEGT